MMIRTHGAQRTCLNVGSWRADANEGIEVVFPSTVAVGSISVVFYNGVMPGGAVTYGTAKTLSNAVSIGATGFSVAATTYPGIQNGPNDGVALVCGGSVIQLLSWEGVLTASNGPAAGKTSTDIGVSEDGAHSSADFSIMFCDLPALLMSAPATACLLEPWTKAEACDLHKRQARVPPPCRCSSRAAATWRPTSHGRPTWLPASAP